MSRMYIHTGRVIDEQGQPLIGAHVITVNKPKRGVVTDQNGNFTVDGQLHEAFEIGHVGFESWVFRIEKYASKKTYILKEDVFELDGFTGTPTKPHVPRPDRPSEGKLWNIFGGAADTLLSNLDVFRPLPTRPAQPKVETITYGPATGNQTITTTGSQGKVHRPGITDLINDNPIATGGLVLGAITLFALVMNKGEE